MNKIKKNIFMILYWIIQLSWGALMTITGLIVSWFCVVFLKGKPHRNGFSYIVEIGGNWGGVSLGAIALCGSYSQKDGPCYDPNWYEHTRKHEFGHSIQNMILGPLFPFIVAIPSMCRYWYQRLTPGPHQEYDYAIFEYTASKWGYKWINWIENTNLEYKYQRVKK